MFVRGSVSQVIERTATAGPKTPRRSGYRLNDEGGPVRKLQSASSLHRQPIDLPRGANYGTRCCQRRRAGGYDAAYGCYAWLLRTSHISIRTFPW